MMRSILFTVVICFLTKTSITKSMHQNQDLESYSDRILRSVQTTEGVRLLRKRVISSNSTNNTPLIPTLIPKRKAISTTELHGKGRERTRLHNHRMQHLDSMTRGAQSHHTKLHRRHRKKKITYINTNATNPHAFVDMLSSNKTCSCCNQNTTNNSSNKINFKDLAPGQTHERSSQNSSVYNSNEENTPEPTEEFIEKEIPRIMEGDFKSYTVFNTTPARILDDMSFANKSLGVTQVSDDDALSSIPPIRTKARQSSGKHSTVKLATVLAVVVAMLLLPFLALWLHAVMSAARERVENRNADQELPLAAHV